MPNIVIPNTLINSSNEKFHAFWKLTRGLLAAGWRYKASADGNNKETTGVPNLDLWSSQGYTNLTQVPGQSGSAASLLTVANGVVTVQGLTGMTANSVGRALTISGDTDIATDNGTFRITSFISSSSVTIYNPNATTISITNTTGNGVSPITVTVGSTAGLSSGQQVGIFGVLGNTAANGIWTINVTGTTTFTLTGSTGNGAYAGGGVVGTDAANGSITWAEKYGGAGASVTTVLNGVATITGLTGMTANSVGHRITIIGAASGGNNGTFMISAFVSATSVKIFNSTAVAGDANNGSINWVERDPTTDVYPANLATGAWICLQGPSTLKVPIGNATPAFTRGEKVTQAATGTEAEVLGVATDTAGSSGYLVLAPRVNGSGGGPRGWDQSIITAQSAPAGSGASVTPTATVIEYVREIVIWKNLATTGHIYYQCIDQAGEATTTAIQGRFSTLATLGTATATICPGGATGGNPTTNGFPTVGTFTVVGTGGSGAAGTGSSDFESESATAAGMIQIACANNIEGTGASQDGSWTIAIGTPGSSPTSFNINGFLRVDNGEDGDVDPYVFFCPSSLTAYTRTRTVGTSPSGGADWVTTNAIANGTSFSCFLGFRRRGLPNEVYFQEFSGFVLQIGNNAQSAMTSNYQNPETVACTFAAQPARVREPILVASTQLGQKMRKGYLRWWYSVSGGNATDTLDGKKWAQLTSQVAANSAAVVIGPWDGTSIPFQT